jgi:DNA repair exonuclease SbcCD ATPase subunit
MKVGFALRRLALIGPGKAPDEIKFKRGLKVISGPSDSGKSFIAQCLDYALGSGALPKEIPEAEGYSSVVLEIEANSDGRVYSLERSLRGGDIRRRTDGQPDRELAAKH